jgi:hypothetical protein
MLIRFSPIVILWRRRDARVRVALMADTTCIVAPLSDTEISVLRAYIASDVDRLQAIDGAVDATERLRAERQCPARN